MENKSSKFLTTKRICRIALMAAMMVAVKDAMSWLPNGEFVTAIVCVGTLVFGWEMLLTTVVFSALEIFIYGFGLWTVMYLYVWNVLVIVVMLLKPLLRKNHILWTIVMAIYGLIFGALCAIPYLFIGGWSMAFTWWISGIPFDLMHGGWNAVLGFVSFKPLMYIMQRSKEEKINRED